MLEDNKRNYGIDVLRIVSMFLVTSTHMLGALDDANIGTFQYWETYLLKVICLSAVNCYIILAGYVGIGTKHEINKIVKLWVMVLFYSVTITMICFFLFSENESFEDVIKAFMPVLSIRYWYFSGYILLYFFMPMIDTFILNSPKEKQYVSLLAIIMMAVGGTVFNALNDMWSMNDGYSVFWMFVMYYIGAFFRMHPLMKNIKWSIVFIICVFVTYLSKIGIYYFNGFLNLNIDDDLLITYISPITILAAISLVMLFSKINVPTKSISTIRFITPMIFSVYIIHYNKMLWKEINNVLEQMAENSSPWMPILVIAMAVIIFVICLIIDAGRAKLFDVLKINKRIDSIVDKLQEKINLKRENE